ncbi:AraC family transcriptional regulator [Sediminibacillus massiliensis]|uniref:AraC family transcriptional regulator n=1 Tax=Sediminibacillus massiliensis TaxID=1926277 RepID=UPI000988714C|nr:helix-turn-helix domain-containing protein [Sediminibacillus massiliensis]
MSFLQINIEKPVQYVSGGRFVTETPWTHSKRVIDSFQIIIGINETLYIEQEGTKYEVKPGETLLLFPDCMHQGYQICNRHVSFYWFHFLSSGISIQDKLDQEQVIKIRTEPESRKSIKDIFLPNYASPPAFQRLNILSNQLLHVDNANYFTRMSMDYLMTSLLIELSEQTISHSISTDVKDMHLSLNEIIEWTRINALEGISVGDVADKFCYHKDYLSRFFKKKTGKTLQEYIHVLRMSKAKELLIGTRLGVKDVANRVGISDEKYFMRLFKKYEKMTPTQYRRAFNKTHLNSK